MPIPQKQQGESNKEFMQRCMGDETMVSEYPEEGQRYAVCQSQIENMKVLLYGNIGEKVDGDAISQQLREMASQSETIDVHINSYGGDVQQGVSIFSTIISLNNEGKEVNTYIDGFAASIASIIAMAGKKIFMNDFARIMVHEAFMGDNSNLSENDKKALNEINDMLAQILSRRGVNKNSIQKKMREETWIRSGEAKELGMVDEVMETKAVLKDRAELIIESNEDISKKLSYVTNLLGEMPYTIVNFENNDKMERLKAKLNLKSEDEIINRFDDLNGKVETLQNEKSKLEKEKSELKKENETLKKEKTERTKNEITTLIDNAIQNGKLSEEKKDELIEQGQKAPEAIKAFINSLPEPQGQLLSEKWKAEMQTKGGAEKEKQMAEEYERMAKEEPQALRELEKTNSEKFNKLYNAYINH